ncbi:MAG: hypothetical protein ACTS4V_01445 [Candidatus Hodgkinia cicadicola]
MLPPPRFQLNLNCTHAVPTLRRVTFETDAAVSLRVYPLQVFPKSWVITGIGFLDHVLSLFASCAGLTLNVCCAGDSWIDWHHVCEDAGIALGLALSAAIRRYNPLRYASALVPMDETLVQCSFDLHGGGGFYSASISRKFPQTSIADLIYTTLDASAKASGICLHIDVLKSGNIHHIAEAMFKAFGLCVRKSFNSSCPITTKGNPLLIWR